jgi:PLP dependent protein
MSPSQTDASVLSPRNTSLDAVLRAIAEASAAAGRGPQRLLAVSKTRNVEEIAALAGAWSAQRSEWPEPADGSPLAFGENYVQEALAKQPALAGLGLEWHLIGHLQSNKAKEAAQAFDWVQTVDRLKLAKALAAHRPAARPPLNVLIQVNIDDEASKHGCRPEDVETLAAAIAAEPRLLLRGLMAIPAPDPDMGRRRLAFRRMRVLFDTLTMGDPSVDTLSMGMSEDYALAIAEGATMVRIGSALFGPRATPPKGNDRR